MITTKERLGVCADLKSAARALSLSNLAYDKAWVNFWHTVEPIGKKRFWELLRLFRSSVLTYKYGYKRSNGVEQAADEFFRKAVVEPSSYSMPEAYAFAKAYNKAVGIMDKRHGRLFEFSGDSFGDLMDSLPMAGEEFFERKFSTEEDLYAAIRELDSPWPEFILRENYVAMMLQDSAKKYTLVAIDIKDSEE